MRFTRSLDYALGTRSRVAVLRYLTLTGLELTGRQIARAVNVSSSPLNRVLADLAAEGFLVQRNVGRTYLFRLNLSNPLVSEMLVPLFRYERDLLRRALGETLEGLMPRIRSALVYGSVGRAQEEPSSDVDLLVVTDEVEELKHALAERAVAFLERYGNMLSPLVLSPAELRQRYLEGDEFVREVLTEGQLVAGQSAWELIHRAD